MQEEGESKISTTIVVESPPTAPTTSHRPLFTNSNDDFATLPPVQEVLIRQREEPSSVPLFCGIGESLECNPNLRKRGLPAISSPDTSNLRSMVMMRGEQKHVKKKQKTNRDISVSDDSSSDTTSVGSQHSHDVSTQYSGGTPVINNHSTVATSILSPLYAPMDLNTKQEKEAFHKAISDLMLS